MAQSICPECYRSFENNPRGTKRFCSNACKQSNHRKNTPARSDSNDDGLTTTDKAQMTKLDRIKTKECLWCRMYFFPNGNQGKQKFCSAKCRQAWYRYGLQWRKKIEAKPVLKVVEDDPDKELKRMLEATMMHQEGKI